MASSDYAPLFDRYLPFADTFTIGQKTALDLFLLQFVLGSSPLHEGLEYWAN